ncbi:cysteine desulfurase NifS [Moorella sp. Hama-1]|uniref:cysteine desulfurase NifS n=1 Tax=Moorella sp. Hama-1 TaxID=2138101 RepID=UPI000D65067D|nr:cysteine desulfurase NifS [Moorella sp. Hama-1]BCV21891.1 cysteine desulfurase IscS [Moorella sp. Hama-1]
MRRVYLDHSATTPVRPEVLEAMLPFLKDEAFGNPSTIYSYGREAKKALDEAREKVANLIGARPEEIFFTSGGTEADNLALIGTAAANEKKGRHIITSSIEHHAVLHTAQYLLRHGFKVTFLPVTPEGLVRVEDVEKAITDETILISVMHVNNEVGTIQPIKAIGQLARERGIIFHSDAVQSAGKIPVNVDELGVDLLSVSGHKIYGPKGIGCLYIRKGTRINPILYGGAQERKRRPGTENMPGIVGFGRAAELAGQELKGEMERLQGLRDKLIDGILSRIEDVQLNGDPRQRVATNANFSFLYVEGESLLLSLDMKGICASSGSACTSGSLDPSHVLLAMGLPHEVAHGSVRMTLGRDNTEEDIDYVLEVMPEIVARLRSMSPLYNQAGSNQ